jgi:hypothetical protein
VAVYIAESGVWSIDGGDGGEVGVRAYNAATNNGAVTANGGDGGEFGGRGGGLYVMSRAGHASNTGVVTANGGDGAEAGGHGGYTAAFGATAANSGNADLNGGNATDPLSVYPLVMTYGFEYGGDGGEVYVSGIGLNAAASYTGTVSYTGGTATEGGVAGEDGSTTIGIECEGNCN